MDDTTKQARLAELEALSSLTDAEVAERDTLRAELGTTPAAPGVPEAPAEPTEPATPVAGEEVPAGADKTGVEITG